MFEHSQALHAHSQQQRQQSHTPTSSTAAPSSQQESSYDPLASLQHGTVSSVPRQPITQDQLASALASAMSSSSSLNASPLASLNQPQLHRRYTLHATPLFKTTSDLSLSLVRVRYCFGLVRVLTSGCLYRERGSLYREVRGGLYGFLPLLM